MDGMRKDCNESGNPDTKNKFHKFSPSGGSQLQFFRDKYITWSNDRNQESKIVQWNEDKKMCAKDNKRIQVKLKGTGYAVQVFNWGEEEGKENNIEYIF